MFTRFFSYSNFLYHIFEYPNSNIMHGAPLFCFFPFCGICPPFIPLSIKSEIMNRFWHSRYLNNCIDLPNIIRSFASGANISLVAINRTKYIPIMCIKFLSVNRFWCLRCRNNCIDLLDIIDLFASGTTNSLGAKIKTRNCATYCSVYKI